MPGAFGVTDFVIVGGYFTLVLCIAAWTRLRHSRGESGTDYFLAERSAGWFAVGCSFFASNIGSDALVGLAGTGAASGMVGSVFDWGSPPFFIVLGWIFMPFYLKTGVFTMPEFIERRFDGRCRTYLAIIALLGFIPGVSATLLSGSVVVESVLPWPRLPTVLGLLCLTASYTAIGGMQAVIYTEVAQTAILLTGSIALLGLSLHAVGGATGLSERLPSSFAHMMHLGDPYPAPGLLVGYPLMSFWFHVCNQEMVQRGLAAKNLRHSQGGALFGGYLKLLPPLLFVLPGMVARALYPDLLGCVATDDTVSCAHADRAFPVLVTQLLPQGLRGMVVAAMLAAMMSSISSVFNSASTIITMDMVRRIRPQSSDAFLVRTGRVVTLCIAALAVAWIPMLYRLSGQLYVAMQSVTAVLAPPIAITFFLGIFWPRANAQGALAGLAVGHITGAVRLVLVLALEPGTGGFFATTNFLYFAAFIGSVALATNVLVSLCTGRPCYEKTAGLTWQTADESLAIRHADEGLEMQTVAEQPRDKLSLKDADEERMQKKPAVFPPLGVAVPVSPGEPSARASSPSCSDADDAPGRAPAGKHREEQEEERDRSDVHEPTDPWAVSDEEAHRPLVPSPEPRLSVKERIRKCFGDPLSHGAAVLLACVVALFVAFR